MNYNGFMEYVAKHIKEYLPAEYQTADIRLDVVKKTNEQYTGMMIRREDNDYAPVINMKMFYEHYESGRSVNDIMKDMADIVQMPPPANIGLDGITDYEQAKKNLFVRLSPAEGNEEMMADGPFRMAADLLMTYHIYIQDQEGEGFMSARITNDIMKNYGITAEQLHQDALDNTSRIFKPKLQDMMEVMTGVPEKEPKMLIITNNKGLFGAGALFCEGVMDMVTEQMKGDYFVLPSSQHEFIAVPDNGEFERTELEAMVREVNKRTVDDVDKLSDQVYHYDHKERIFERADIFEERTQEKAAEKESLLGKLQSKREQVERSAPTGRIDKQRHPGLVM